jgi:hypothetical protein
MHLNIAKEQAALERLPMPRLRSRYAEVFGEATRAHNRVWLIRRILWRLQALAEGDLSERARQRAAELANDADLRTVPPRDTSRSAVALRRTRTGGNEGERRLPPAGTVIVRAYKGRTLHVRVLSEGFEFEETVYASLSAVAKAITGSHTNGFLFFKLGVGVGVGVGVGDYGEKS